MCSFSQSLAFLIALEYSLYNLVILNFRGAWFEVFETKHSIISQHLKNTSVTATCFPFTTWSDIMFQGFSGPNDPQQKHAFSSSQLQQLRVQIMAYRLLSRNQPLSQQIAMAVQTKRIDPPLSHPNQCPTPPYQQQQQQLQQQQQQQQRSNQQQSDSGFYLKRHAGSRNCRLHIRNYK
jgi:hypothetical protein